VNRNRGDRAAQRARRKARYKGCRVCGEPNTQHCVLCRSVEAIVADYQQLADLRLFVDGSFIVAGTDPRDLPHASRPRVRRPRFDILRDQLHREHPTWTPAQIDAALLEALGGNPVMMGPGHGGAGLVLATIDGKILASRACAFAAENSSDAELLAVIRGARWVPGVVIYTDSESTCLVAAAMNHRLDVRFARPEDRGEAHELAHQRSVEGRSRQQLRSTPI
jgi:hypothetical protein